VWRGAMSSWKTATLFGNNIWIMGCSCLPNLLRHSLAVIRPWRVIMEPTDYRDTVVQTITEPPPCFNDVTRHPGLCRLSWAFTERKLFLM
jgi:hypothetical protein